MALPASKKFPIVRCGKIVGYKTDFVSITHSWYVAQCANGQYVVTQRAYAKKHKVVSGPWSAKKAHTLAFGF